VLAQLDELRDRNVIREAAGRNQFDYVFTHHLIQAAVYDAVPLPERVRWHHRVARLIEQSKPYDERERAAVLARHYELGDDPARSSRWYLRAAQQAYDVRALSESVDLAGRGLMLTGDPHVKRDLLLLRETALGMLGDRSGQRRTLDDLGELAAALHDSELVATVLKRRVWFHRVLGERHAERAAIDTLLESADASSDLDHRSAGLLERGTFCELVGDYDAAVVDLTDAAALYAAAGNVEREAECYCALARLAAHRERVAEARAMIDRALAIADRAGPRVRAKLLETAANESAVRGDFAASEAAAHELLRMCRAAGDRSGEVAAHLSLANAANALLQVGVAHTHYEAAGRICTELGDVEGQARTLHDGAVLHISVGNNAGAQQSLAQAEELFLSIGHERGAGYCALNLSALAFQTEQYEEGKAAAGRALEAANKMKNRGLEAAAYINLAINEAKLSDLSQALAHAQRGADLIRTAEQPADLAAFLAELALVRALARDARGAVQAADECLSLLEQHRSQVRWPLVILWQAAQVYRSARRHKRSKDLLDEAYLLLRERAAEMPDEETRASFESVCYHRDLSAAHDRGAWPALGASTKRARSHARLKP
jgi:tetratricopeptide (TPR) repeat protein